MYWSDMFDANQTPGWYVTWAGWQEVASGSIEKDVIVSPWYYSANLPSLWRIRDSMDFFLERGHPAIGTSGHEPLNQFMWGQSILERMGRYRTDGFTFTIWTNWGELPVLEEGLRAYAQNTWSASCMPFQNLTKLRLELETLDDNGNDRVSDYYRNYIGELLVQSENELSMVDSEILEKVNIGGLPQLLDAMKQAKFVTESDVYDLGKQYSSTLTP